MPLGGLGLLALVAVAQAGAAPSGSVPVRVDFDAPAGCSDVDAFLGGVLARTTHVHRAGAGETGVRLVVRLSRSGGRVRGELRVNGAGGEAETRRVEGANCAEVVQVLSLTAALAIDPTASLVGPSPPERAPPAASPPRASPPERASPAPQPPSPPAPPPTPAAPPPLPPPAPVAPPPAPPAPPPPEPPPPVVVAPPPAASAVAQAPPVELVDFAGPRLGASMLAGRLLTSSVGVGASVWGRFAVATRGGLDPSATLSFVYMPGDFFEPGDDLGVRWTALAATICPGFGLGVRARLEPCARATVGLLSATDQSINTPRTVEHSWGSAGALVRFLAPIGLGLSLDVEAGVDLPFITRRFITTTTEPNPEVGATATASTTLAVGLSHGL